MSVYCMVTVGMRALLCAQAEGLRHTRDFTWHSWAICGQEEGAALGKQRTPHWSLASLDVPLRVVDELLHVLNQPL